MLSNTDPSQRSATPNNNQEWQHEVMQSPTEISQDISFDPPPPPSPTRVYVSPKCFRRSRSDEDSFLNCSKQSYSSATMSLSSLAMPSLDFPTESTSPQEVSLRPRFSYITPTRSTDQFAVSARERRANVARILHEALQMMEYYEENRDDDVPVHNF